ncbi:MAG: c-type cytochrome [Sulfitobacter sp.]
MKTTVKTMLACGLGAGLIATAAFAESHSNETNKAVSARHAQMEMIAYHTGILGGIAKGEAEFDADTVRAAAENLQALASLAPATLWTPGTEQGAVEGSRAKAEVFSDMAGFETKLADLANAAGAVAGAADAAAVGAGMGAVGGACKACHETYRGPKN